MKLTFYSDDSSDDIPRKPGVYAFFYMGVSKSLLGFSNSDTKITSVRSNTKTLIERQLKTFSHGTYSGEMSSNDSSSHIRPPMRAALKEKRSNRDAERVLNISDQEIVGFIELMSASCVFQRPLYVGITTQQTLAERYQQHRHTYMRGGFGFGSSFRNAGLSWTHLIFGCIAYSEHRLSHSTTRLAERLIQSLSSPVFSKQ